MMITKDGNDEKKVILDDSRTLHALLIFNSTNHRVASHIYSDSQANEKEWG